MELGLAELWESFLFANRKCVPADPFYSFSQLTQSELMSLNVVDFSFSVALREIHDIKNQDFVFHGLME